MEDRLTPSFGAKFGAGAGTDPGLGGDFGVVFGAVTTGGGGTGKAFPGVGAMSVLAGGLPLAGDVTTRGAFPPRGVAGTPAVGFVLDPPSAPIGGNGLTWPTSGPVTRTGTGGGRLYGGYVPRQRRRRRRRRPERRQASGRDPIAMVVFVMLECDRADYERNSDRQHRQKADANRRRRRRQIAPIIIFDVVILRVIFGGGGSGGGPNASKA